MASIGGGFLLRASPISVKDVNAVRSPIRITDLPERELLLT
ncbi:hypothetical protein [Longispora fulva]|uniref:Uncharacterized protein n=1 Tax=Longispora fulva TaxID=619741 RepID=A0A8J7GFH1_9ACTN|nr:hypothetical protein [Longispora fulva]MBG6136811.1 hypothetical protein [Longispora fulva]